MSNKGIDKSLWSETCHGRWMAPEYEVGLISVIVPTYNRAHFVTEPRDSVWRKTDCGPSLNLFRGGNEEEAQE